MICGLTYERFTATAERGIYLWKYIDFLNNEVSNMITVAERGGVADQTQAILGLVAYHEDAEVHAFVESDLNT